MIKDGKRRLCVKKLGLGGIGYYVKMVYNGIEYGMMMVFFEVWEVMIMGFGMSYDEVGDVFENEMIMVF